MTSKDFYKKVEELMPKEATIISFTNTLGEDCEIVVAEDITKYLEMVVDEDEVEGISEPELVLDQLFAEKFGNTSAHTIAYLEPEEIKITPRGVDKYLRDDGWAERNKSTDMEIKSVM